MSEYGKLMSSIWGDKDFTALNDREQKVFMMLFSFPTRNLAGVVPLTIRRWSKCSSDATETNVKAALLALAKLRFIIIDLDTEEVLIRTYIRNDEVWKQPNLMTRCLRYCEAVASERLKAEIAIELQRCVDEFMPSEKPGQQKIKESTALMAKVLEERYGGTFTDAMQEGLFDTFGEPPGDSPTPSPPPPPPTTPAPAPVQGPQKSADSKPRGCRLPDGWEPPEDTVRSMRDQFPEVNLRHEHEKFCDYWHAKSGQDATKRDWVATWRNWIRTAAERAGAVGTLRTSASDRAVVEADALRDNPRLPQNRRFDALFPEDRKELTP